MTQNTKNGVIVAGVIVVAIVAFLAGGTLKKHKKPPGNMGLNGGVGMGNMKMDIDGVPDVPPSVTGQFVAVDGDQLIVERVMRESDGVDKGEMQKKMQSLSDGGRQQMREARRAERETAEMEKVFVTIDNDTVIMNVTESGEGEEVDITSLGEGSRVMIWKDGSNATIVLQNNMMKKEF